MPWDADSIGGGVLAAAITGRFSAPALAAARAALGDGPRLRRVTGGELAEICGWDAERAGRWAREVHAADVDGERMAIRRCGVRMLLAGDADWPPLLGLLNASPGALWIVGEIPVHPWLPVAVVGSRSASAYGAAATGSLVRALAAAGCSIISGGALGIDTHAHRTAITAGAPTVAVVGGGLEVPYPERNCALFKRIVESGGAVVSESPVRVLAMPYHFLPRNRIIAGLSHGVVVVEAALRSGALGTARLAVDEFGREAMAVPGPVNSPTSAGCHRAIREGWAGLACSAEDVMSQLRFATALSGAACGAPEVRARIVEALAAQPAAGVEELCRRCGLTPQQVRTELTVIRLMAK